MFRKGLLDFLCQLLRLFYRIHDDSNASAKRGCFFYLGNQPQPIHLLYTNYTRWLIHRYALLPNC